MKRWNLKSLPPSTEKQQPRAAGPDALRVPQQERAIPRVLFSAPECRAVVVELESGEKMGDHHVRERAVVQVTSGRVEITASGETAECSTGTLITFAPHELHSVRALEPSILLLILAPWPAAEHYADGEAELPQRLPRNAFVAPAESGISDI